MIGRELFVQAAPELVEVVKKKKTSKQAIKSTVRKTTKTSWRINEKEEHQEKTDEKPFKDHSQKTTSVEQLFSFLL